MAGTFAVVTHTPSKMLINQNSICRPVYVLNSFVEYNLTFPCILKYLDVDVGDL